MCIAITVHSSYKIPTIIYLGRCSKVVSATLIQGTSCDIKFLMYTVYYHVNYTAYVFCMHCMLVHIAASMIIIFDLGG